MRRRALAGLVILALVAAVTAALAGCPKKAAVKPKPPVFLVKKVTKANHADVPEASFNVLVLGSDTLGGSGGGRSDAIMLVHVSPKQRSMTFLSFPRDSYVDIPGAGRRKINEAYSSGGPERAVETIERLTGLTIDYYAVTTFVGFWHLIDGMGWVYVDVDRSFTDKDAGVTVTQGRTQMSGQMALGYARARHAVPNGDFGRARHQQDILVGLYKQERPRGIARMLFTLPIVYDNIETDLPFDEAFSLASAVLRVDPEKVRQEVAPGGTGSVGGASVVLLNMSQLSEIAAGMRD